MRHPAILLLLCALTLAAPPVTDSLHIQLQAAQQTASLQPYYFAFSAPLPQDLPALLQQLFETGQDPTNLLRAADVHQTLILLFGRDFLQDGDVAYYRYFSEQQLYVQMGELTGARTAYPQMLSYEKTERGYTCEVLLSTSADAVPMRFTFVQQPDGNLILTAPAFSAHPQG